MGTILRYFREHPWQRRVLTCLVAATLGVTAGWLLWPDLRDLYVLEMLGSGSAGRRERAMDWAVELARQRPQLIARMERRLATAGDVQFSAIVEVLNRLGIFHAPGRSGEQLDRHRALSLAASGPAGPVGARLIHLHALILGGRDNAHVRRGLQLAIGDPAAEVRSAAAVLAARLGDDETLRRLLGDEEPTVRSAAAIDAGLARRTGCVEAIAALCSNPRTDEELAAGAYALARLDPERFGPGIAASLESAWQSGRSELLDRLLYVATLLREDVAAPAVLRILDHGSRGGAAPPAMALLAAGRIGSPRAQFAAFVDQAIKTLLARPKEKLTMGDAQTLAAAANAARRLGMDGDVFVGMIRQMWHPWTALAMILAVEGLTEVSKEAPERMQAPEPATLKEVSNRGKQRLEPQTVVEILERAVDYESVVTFPDGTRQTLKTPVASAAAAVGVFRLAPEKAPEALRRACESRSWAAGDYVAWNLARAGAGRERAWRIAAAFFGPGVYDEGVRSAGAAMLSMMARGTDQADAVAEAVEARLAEATRGGGANPFLAGAYYCALVSLGRKDFADEVQALVEAKAFPMRRALTALVLAGEPAGFDYVLSGETFDPARMDSYLTARLMARVYAAAIEGLPAFDIDAPVHVRYWQCRILRDYYLIHRRAILDRALAGSSAR